MAQRFPKYAIAPSLWGFSAEACILDKNSNVSSNLTEKHFKLNVPHSILILAQSY